MGSIFRKAFCITSVIVASFEASGQGTSPPFFQEKGGLMGAGFGVNSLNIPEGKYTPLFFIAHFGKYLVKTEDKIPQYFTLFFEPQINPVILQRSGKNGTALEMGINVGVQHMYPLSRNLYIYTLISTGPHFITVHTERQARGFIFSDNMGAGVYYFISKNWALTGGMRIRHISNANTAMPNHGINTINYLTGISFMVR